MERRNCRFEIGLKALEQEHTAIRRLYLVLDDAILHGDGSPKILEAAGSLMESMRQHLEHEELFQREVSFPMHDDQRRNATRTATELLYIEQGLRDSEVYAALRLRGLCKGWMHEHMYVENVEFDIGSNANRGNNPARLL